MPVPSLSAQQRARALEQAAEARRQRSLLRDRLKHGRTTLADVEVMCIRVEIERKALSRPTCKLTPSLS